MSYDGFKLFFRKNKLFIFKQYMNLKKNYWIASLLYQEENVSITNKNGNLFFLIETKRTSSLKSEAKNIFKNL